MSEPTGTPAPALVAAALRELANLAATLYVRQPDGPTVVQILGHEADERDTILAALTGHRHEHERAGAGVIHRWTGRLAGWPLLLVQWTPTEAGEQLLAESARLSEQAGDELARAIVAAQQPEVDEDQGADEVDTSPVTAAAEQPAGLASSWPVAAEQPTPPPAELLPSPSWSRVGLAAVMGEPMTPLVFPRPRRDRALIGHDPILPGQLVDLAAVRNARQLVDDASEVTA